MLAIDEPKLYCAPDGTPRLFTCWLGHQPGFTPMRGGNATWHSPSHAAIADYSIQASNQEVTIDYWMLFRLSKLADLLGVALIHHSAPYATIRIILTISTSGTVRVRFRSSFIPSQHFYAGWRLVGKHDMIDCTEEDYWGFIKAGKRRNAPEADRFEMELEAKALAVEV